MADELDNFITALTGKMEEMAGIVDAPVNPPEGVQDFPVAICYYVEGNPSVRPEIWVHTFHADVHLGRGSLPDDEAAARPYILLGLAKIYANLTMDGTCLMCEPKKVQYGRLGYGETETFGVRFVIAAKMQHSTITAAA